MKSKFVLFAVTFTAATLATSVALAQGPGDMGPMMPGQGTGTTVTNATGTISQLNYGGNGQVEGFLIGTNILLEFPWNPAAGIASLGAVGNNVTYSGTSVTNTTTNFSTVHITSFTNNTTKATYSSSTNSQVPTAYGPTTGQVKQINYDESGSIDGFVFLPSGSTTPVFVSTGSGASSTLKPLLAGNPTASVTGTTMPAAMTAACVSTGALTAVQASSITVGGQTIVITSRPSGGMGGMRGH